PACGAIAKGTSLIKIVIMKQKHIAVGAVILGIVNTLYNKVPGSAAVFHGPDSGDQWNSVADIPAKTIGKRAPCNCPYAIALPGLQLFWRQGHGIRIDGHI